MRPGKQVYASMATKTAHDLGPHLSGLRPCYDPVTACILFSRMHCGFGRCLSRQPPSIPMSQTGTQQVFPTCLRYAPSDRVCVALSSLGAIFVPCVYGVISRLSIVFAWPRWIGLGCIRCYIASCRAALGLARRCSTPQQPSTPMSRTGTRQGFRR